jgi:hypothetical protein
MESNSKANKIQLSQETADLLQKAGKSHWIQAREDLIKAKVRVLVSSSSSSSIQFLKCF